MTSQSRSKPRFSVEQCRDPGEWDGFVRRHGGSPFALWGWGNAVETYGHDRRYLVARDEDEMVGSLPLFYMQSKLFGSKLVSPPFGERGSLILDDTNAETVTELLLERTKELSQKLAVDFVSLRGGTVPGRNGFERRNRFVTFRVPLSDGRDAIWERMKSSRQRQITQASESDLRHDVGDSIEDLREYYRLYLATMRGHGSPPHSFEFFRTLWDSLSDDTFRMEMLRKDGSLVNAIVNLSLGSTVYQWGVVNDYDHRDLNGGSLLVWKSLEWALESGYDAYEFGRTREGSGVYTFKKSFGGEKRWYDDLHYFPGESESLPHPEKKRYEPVKRVWSRLPSPVTKFVGPHLRKNISL